MVLATDEVFTYAMFNYLEINWSSHTEAGGDTTTGEGGVPAYVSNCLIYIYYFCEQSNIFTLAICDVLIAEYILRKIYYAHA